MPRLECLRRKIAKARVPALAIVIDFDVLKHVVSGGLPRDKAFTVDGHDIEAVVPGLHGGMVVAVASLAHAAYQAVIPHPTLIVARAVLAVAVGVDADATWSLAPLQRHRQGIARQSRRHALRHGPAHDPA